MKVRIHILGQRLPFTDRFPYPTLEGLRTQRKAGGPQADEAQLLFAYSLVDPEAVEPPRRLAGFCLVELAADYLDYDNERCGCGKPLQDFVHRHTQPTDESCTVHGCPDYDNVCPGCAG